MGSQYCTTPRSENCTHSSSDWDILGKDNALNLDDEEVDEVFKVVEGGFQCFLRDLVVFSGADRAGHTRAHESLARGFSNSDNPKTHPGKLDHIADDGEVSGGEDEGESGHKGDAGRALVLPAQEGVEAGLRLAWVFRG